VTVLVATEASVVFLTHTAIRRNNNTDCNTPTRAAGRSLSAPNGWLASTLRSNTAALSLHERYSVLSGDQSYALLPGAAHTEVDTALEKG
jgi:hypothetical protein